MKVILAARETDIRLASQLLLTQEPNVEVVGTASTVSGLLALLKTYQVGIVILDQDLFKKSTDDLIPKIKNSQSNPQVILLGPEDLGPEAVFELGADIFVNKTEPPERLLSAFRRLAAEINLKASKDKENIKS